MTLPVVLITGASGGIGEQLALAAAATKQYRLALVARRADVLQAVVEKCRGLGRAAFVADASVREQVSGAVAAVVAQFGTVDVLVNNVGRGVWQKPSELTEAVIEDMMRANVYSALFGIQAVLPIFKEKKSGQFINVSSLLGRNAEFAPMRSAYSGSKHFLNALTGSLRGELAAEYPGIVFTTVSPGIVKTDFGLNAGGPDSRSFAGGQETEEVASIILTEAIGKRKTEVYTSEFVQNVILKYIQRTADISSA